MSRRKKTASKRRHGASPKLRLALRRAARAPVWEWPTIAGELARDEGGSIDEWLKRMMRFEPSAERYGRVLPMRFELGDGVSLRDIVRTCSLVALEYEWDAATRRHRLLELEPTEEDEELIAAFDELSAALWWFQEAVDRHDDALGCAYEIPYALRQAMALFARHDELPRAS